MLHMQIKTAAWLDYVQNVCQFCYLRCLWDDAAPMPDMARRLLVIWSANAVHECQLRRYKNIYSRLLPESLNNYIFKIFIITLISHHQPHQVAHTMLQSRGTIINHYHVNGETKRFVDIIQQPDSNNLLVILNKVLPTYIGLI